MGRLTDDILPTIHLLLRKETSELDKMEIKMMDSMKEFVEMCIESYDKMEEIDGNRFTKVSQAL